MKYLVIILTFVLVTPASFAQDNKGTEASAKGFIFGVSAGINAATKSYNYTIQPTPPFPSIRLAPSGGIILGYQFSNAFALQTLWKYQGKGDKISIENWLDSYEQPQTVNAVWEIIPQGNITSSLHYFELSLLPVIGLGKFQNSVQLQLGIGGFAAYGLAGKQIHDYSFTYYLDYELDDEEIINLTKEVEFVNFIPTSYNENQLYLNSLDYGLLAYGGIRYNGLNIGLYFSYGMNDLEFNSFNFGYWTAPKDISRTATLTMAFNYIF